MAVLKCKQCGGTIGQIENGIGICDYCDVKQTIISVNDEKIINFIDRANGFRIQQEFDKAMEIYEKVLEEVQNDSDIYYQIALCRYGVYYVDDPKTGRKIPTISRMQKTKFTEDADFKMAVKYATEEQNELYKEEGKYIDKLYDHIQLIVKNEKPYDIFICYKESDDNNDRTVDSVEAYKIYQELQKEGYKVFFSRVTLEDKIGTEYEPYIFAALYSSKIMIAIGSKKEYFEAPWVKNEWSRYCSLIKSGERKKLMPVYFDMDINDIPYEIRSQLQARNLKTLGFMQDLLRGIKKEIGNEKESATINKEIISNISKLEVTQLLERAKLFLEEGNFEKAYEYCDRVLDKEPKNGTAYFYLILSEKGIKSVDELDDTKYVDLLLSKEFEKVYSNVNGEIVEVLPDVLLKLADKISKSKSSNDINKAMSLYEKIGKIRNISQDEMNKIDELRLSLINNQKRVQETENLIKETKDIKHKELTKKFEKEDKTNKIIIAITVLPIVIAFILNFGAISRMTNKPLLTQIVMGIPIIINIIIAAIISICLTGAVSNFIEKKDNSSVEINNQPKDDEYYSQKVIEQAAADNLDEAYKSYNKIKDKDKYHYLRETLDSNSKSKSNIKICTVREDFGKK